MSKILLGVTGGIAAYKTPELVRQLRKKDHQVRVVLTDAGSQFVSKLVLSTLSENPVRTSLLDPVEEGLVGHIELADWPDLIIIAPATANTIAKAVHGIADNLLSTILLATCEPILWAPAMNSNMWGNEATFHNMANLRAREQSIQPQYMIEPESGFLACGWEGMGRLANLPDIVEKAQEILDDMQKKRDSIRSK